MRIPLAVIGILVSVGLAPGAHAPPAAQRTRVVMLGTGVPFPDPDRFGPATVIVVDSAAYLVDAGVGVVRRWAAAIRADSLPLRVYDLRTVFFTHLHSDHTLGYPELILTSWTVEKAPRRPLMAYGPVGLASMTEHILTAFAADIRIRTDSGGELAGTSPPAVVAHEIEPGIIYHDALVTVTAFLVHHGTWPQAFGYRIQTPDKVIVISGDAGPPSTVPDQCRQCDILIHEGGYVTPPAEQPSGYQQSFHTSAVELAAIANRSRPRLLILSHQGPLTAEQQAERLRTIRSLYGGAVVIAQDLDVFP